MYNVGKNLKTLKTVKNIEKNRLKRYKMLTSMSLGFIKMQVLTRYQCTTVTYIYTTYSQSVKQNRHFWHCNGLHYIKNRSTGWPKLKYSAVNLVELLYNDVRVCAVSDGRQ